MTIGTSIGPYRLLRHLGTGGMGEVWLAEDTRLDRQVALKMVRADGDPTSRTRLMKEARAAAALNHPHIATVHDVLEHDGEIVVVFEYVEGETLQACIARGPIPVPEAVEIATQITRALAAAHAHGIVHRDLKPGNVIVGAGGHVKVLDFGIARFLSSGTTQTNPVAQPQTGSVIGFVGTASYAAPEQMVSSAVDERADLYALGVVLFEMISGRRPFVGDDPVQLATRKLGTDAPKLSSTTRLVPPVVDQLVAALLQRERDRRPASANDVLKVLKHVYGGPSTTLVAPPRSRGQLYAMAAAAIIVALGGYGAWRWQATRMAPGEQVRPVIAVLPLANVSGDSSREFVAAGMAESLITSLAQLRDVTVLSRAAVADAKARSIEQRKIAAELGATYLIDGNIQEVNGILKITVSLIRSDSSVAWADSVQGAVTEIFDVQNRLAALVAGALRVQVTPGERERMQARSTSNPEALSAYWQGRALLDRRDVKGNLDAAAVEFQRALALDSRFATAEAALGEVYWLKYQETLDAKWAQQAIAAGQSALQLNPEEPTVRYALAVTLAGTGKREEAIAELRHALALQPNYDDARRQLGQVLADSGQIDAAIAEYQQAIALRPNFWGHYSALGRSLAQAGRSADAIPIFQKVIDLQPDNSFGYQQIGFAHHNLGHIDEALRYYELAIERQPTPQAYSNIGAIYHQRGEYQRAVEAYQHAIALRPNSHTTHRNVGDALLKLGKIDEAHEAYRRAARLVESELKVNPRDANLQSFLAVYLQKSGQAASATAVIDEALRAAPADINVRYRAAVVCALQQRARDALQHLELAIRGGYSRDIANEDDDLAALKKFPEFQSLVAKKT